MEKGVLSRQRILDAALEEFANYGYLGASLNRVCKEKNISKGMIYHYFRSKDELYLLCLENCFNDLTKYLKINFENKNNDIESMLKQYFELRLDFFAKNPLYLGLFSDLILNTQNHLKTNICVIKKDFDELNISILKSMLNTASLRKGLTIDTIVKDFIMYTNIFNLVFKDSLEKTASSEKTLQEHEAMVNRLIKLMLYGVLESENKYRNQ
ncbi:MAG TPA: TetR/AcrR family transcriptional regulator [Clostridiales bacterium]|nr:TetR/AcrR family transcriptional regulator [Clostridiales bacterium]